MKFEMIDRVTIILPWKLKWENQLQMVDPFFILAMSDYNASHVSLCILTSFPKKPFESERTKIKREC
jgi:hypothetical protein